MRPRVGAASHSNAPSLTGQGLGPSEPQELVEILQSAGLIKTESINKFLEADE